MQQSKRQTSPPSQGADRLVAVSRKGIGNSLVAQWLVHYAFTAKVTGSIKATECNIKATSAANAKVQILANTCYADASSAADITLAGEAGTLYLKASSAADINALNAKALVNTSADASSGANIKVNAGKALTADASSGGTVAYKSDHDVNIHIKKSSGGSVRKM